MGLLGSVAARIVVDAVVADASYTEVGIGVEGIAACGAPDSSAQSVELHWAPPGDSGTSPDDQHERLCSLPSDIAEQVQRRFASEARRVLAVRRRILQDIPHHLDAEASSK